MHPTFHRYIGIDYSGAKTPTSPLPGLRVYAAVRNSSPPVEIRPDRDGGTHWTRRGIAVWLVDALSGGAPSIVGIDHGFSAPLRYFEIHGVQTHWPLFLDDFQRHWPTDADSTTVDAVRRGVVGAAAARAGDARWRRLTEVRVRAKSVFHFDVPGSVAKSTHAGLPWLRFVRQQLASRVHWWPFDGWSVPPHTSVIAEVYPRLWSGQCPQEMRSADQHDAFSVAAALRKADAVGALTPMLSPELSPNERAVAQTEGWILGVR